MKVVFLFSGDGSFDSVGLPWLFWSFLVWPLPGDRILKLELARWEGAKTSREARGFISRFWS
jgi:hypothetical protein